MVELDCGIRRMALRPPDEAGARPRVFPLFGGDLTAAARRFAVAETLSHLERLVVEGGEPPRARTTVSLPILPPRLVDDEIPPSPRARERRA